MKRGFSVVEVCIVVVIILLLAAITAGALYRVCIELPAAYAAWEKQTGNPKELTYDEWRVLVSVSESRRDGVLIVVP